MELIREWFGALINFAHHLELVIAGLIGGGISARLGRRKDDTGNIDLCVFILTGGVCAYYLTGWVIKIFHIEDANLGAVAFLLGTFGGSFISAILRLIQNADFWTVIADILRSRFGSK